MSLQLMLFVGLGGALGAVGRFTVMNALGHGTLAGFPWSTMLVNLGGALALGALLEVSALAWSPSPEIRAMLVVGVLGSFTTFSTFSMDLYYLIDRGAIVNAALYAMGSVLVCLIAFWAGMSLLRMILS